MVHDSLFCVLLGVEGGVEWGVGRGVEGGFEFLADDGEEGGVKLCGILLLVVVKDIIS